MNKNITLERKERKNENKRYQESALLSIKYFNELKKFSFPAKLIIFSISFFNVLFIILVLSSLFIESSAIDMINVFKSINILSAFKVTISSLSISALITIFLGVPFSFFISRQDRYINKILNIVISLPLLMPPSITGLALLLTFGNRGILSKLNSNLAFTFSALIIVQIFVMLPLFIHTLKNAFDSIDDQIVEAALVEGAVEIDLLFKVYLPLSLKAFITAMVISVLRAAGEFGATIIFAGNLSGKTQTITTAIYSLTQSDLSQAVALAVIMLSFFLFPLFFVEFKVKN